MIVAISDVHLGYEKCNLDVFRNFIEEVLEKERIDHLVLLGDIVDFWRRYNMGVIIENLDILQKLQNLNTKKHFIIGNHDYSFQNLINYQRILGFTFENDVRIESGGKYFRFIHGYQLEFKRILPLYKEMCEFLCETGDEWGEKYFDFWDWYTKDIKISWLRRFFNIILQKKVQYGDFEEMKTMDREELKK